MHARTHARTHAHTHTHTHTPGEGDGETTLVLEAILDDAAEGKTSTDIALDVLTTLALYAAGEDCRLLDGVITGTDPISTLTDSEAYGSTAVAEGEVETISLSV